VVCPRGTAAQQYLLQNVIGVDIVYTQGVESALDTFASGTGDAVLYDQPVLLNWMQSEEARTGKTEYVIVGDPVQIQQYAIAVRPGLTQLQETLTQAILEFYGTEDQLRLDESYFGQTSNGAASTTTTDAPTAALQSQIASLAILVAIAVGAALVLAAAMWIYMQCMDPDEISRHKNREWGQSRLKDAAGFKRQQWASRQESILAPTLHTNDLVWEMWERVEAMYEQQLLQRATGKIYLPMGAEELAPEQDIDVDGRSDSQQVPANPRSAAGGYPAEQP